MQQDLQAAIRISIHVAGQKRPSIVADRRFIQRKAAVRSIAWIATQSAIRHQAMKRFQSIHDPMKSSGCYPATDAGLEPAHPASEIVAERLLDFIGGETKFGYLRVNS